MRLVLVILIAAALSFAGCFGKKADNTNPTDGSGATPTDTSPTSATGGATSTPASSTPSGTGNTSTTPAALPTKQACSGSADWTQADATAPAGVSAPPPTTCNIDPGYSKLVLNVTWASSAPAGAAPDPNGVSVSIGGANCALGGPTESIPIAPCTNKAGTATPGKMTITYSGGPAPIQATVTVTEMQ